MRRQTLVYKVFTIVALISMVLGSVPPTMAAPVSQTALPSASWPMPPDSLAETRPDLPQLNETVSVQRQGEKEAATATITPGQAKRIRHDEAELDVNADAVDAETTVSITSLFDNDMPALDPGMTNVTRGPRKGYRFLPHGMKFNNNLRVKLPYDKSLLPPGFTEEDIESYYFDEEAGHWKELECATVITETQEIASCTDHFTDMINAVVTVPDVPEEPVSLNPTQIKDIKPADPGAGINLIEPPQANNLGDARLSYPIEVPPGRLGIQPELVVEYDSSRGNGWLGLGWDLPLPAITIDTRWGVPRYLPEKESETYLLNGEQLTPLAHRDEFESRVGDEKIFHTRVEGEFQRIIRHGTSPDNYWWEVTDKDGTTYYYGGDLNTDGPAADSVLTDVPESNDGNIFLWALREVRDTHGNNIQYRCEQVVDTGLPQGQGQVDGHNLYPKTITYTGYGDQAGPYKVEFIREGGRPDVIINARGGFKQVTAERLAEIKISYNDNLIRRYQLNYATGAFNKTLLASITQYGADNTEFHTHEFTYYDEVSSEGGYQGFESPGTWITYDDDVIDIPRVDGDTSAIGADEINEGGGNVYLGFNFWAPQKTGSGGFNFAGQRSDTEGKVELIDINGDNLPDKVFVKDGSLWFRLNTSGPNADQNGITFGHPPVEISGINDISKEKAETFSFGPEAYFGLNFMENNAWTWTDQTIYFTDVNGDGLVDLVNNGSVRFNRLDEEGVPAFSLDSPVPFDTGIVHTTGISPTRESLYQQLIDEYPLQDTIRRWLAPYDGQIQISGDVRLVQDTSPERSEYETADGVRVAIQHNGAELWSTSIGPDDYEWKTPTNVDVIPVSAGDRIYFRVQSTPDGNSEADGRYDQVEWDPEINYLPTSSSAAEGNLPDASGNVPPAHPPQAPDDSLQVPSLPEEHGPKVYLPVVQSASGGADAQDSQEPEPPPHNVSANVDANLLDAYHYKASEDFVLAGRRDIHIAMPVTGTVRLTGPLEKLGPTTDDITVLVYHGDITGTRTLVFSQGLAWDQSGILSPTVDIPVEKDDTIQLRVKVDSPIDLTKIEWVPRLFYTATEGDNPVQDDQGNYIIQLHPPYDIDMYPVNDLTSPQQAWIAPYTGTVTATTEVPLILPSPLPYGIATFTGKRPGELVAKRAVTITNGMADNGAVTFDVAEGDALYFDYSVYIPQLGELMRYVPLGVHLEYDPATIDPPLSGSPLPPPVFSVSGTLHTAYRLRDPLLGNGLFAQPYRGWSYVGYNGNRVRATLPITETDLQLSEEQLEEYARTQAEFEDENKRYDGRKEKAYLFVPVPEAERWRGPDDLAWVRADVVSASRLGEQDYIHVPRLNDFSGGTAVTREGGSFNAVLGVGHDLYGGSEIIEGYSYSDVDFLDMNGDLFPDVISTGLDPRDLLGQCEQPVRVQPVRVQFTAPWGALQTPDCIVATEYVRKTDVEGLNFNVGANATKSVGNSQGEKGSAGSQKVTMGLAAYYGKDDQESMYDLIDINGDGLPDRVYQENDFIDVALNLGYTFGGRERWGKATIRTESGSDETLEPGIGFEYNGYEFAGGLAIPDSESKVKQTLLDINGDGLSDWVTIESTSMVTGAISVALNTGNGFTAPTNWSGALLESPSRRTVGLGGGVYFTIPIGPLCPPAECYLIINPGGDYTYSVALEQSDMRDVNGDGYPDLIWSTDESWMQVAPNRTGKTNLLRSMERPLGATITLEYERGGNTTDMPESRWVLSRVTLDDGQPGDGVDQQVTTYQYEGGEYDRWEREFYGFQQVTEAHINPGDNSLYRTIRREFLNDSYYTRGLLAQEVVEANGNKYLETEYTYFLRDVENGNGAVFPALTRIDRRFYEGQSSPQKATYTTYEYDAEFGNLIRFVDAADAGSQDDLEVVIDYFDDPAGRYIVGLPEHIVVRALDTDRVMRERAAELEPDTGALRQVRQYLADASAAVTDLDYDPYGNILRVTGPANYKGQRYSLAYSYDDQVRTYVTRIEDSFGYVSTASYNFKYGQIEHSTDINGNSTDYTYDQFGRVETIAGPYQAGTGLYTLRFEYHHDAEVPWALTQQIDVYRDVGDPIETVVFMDGLARVIQTKRDATIHTGVAGHAQDKMIVSGATVFDFVGRPVEQYYPITEDLGGQGVYNSGQDSVPPTVMMYDVLDRVTSVTIPDGTVTQYEYRFGADRQSRTQFLTRMTDANGGPKEIYRDVRGLATAVKEFNNGGSQIIWTSYEYDPLGQITRVVDDQDNVTQVSYDNLGRRTHINSPDSGLVETVYDLVSNRTQVIPASLRAGGKAILYDYDYNRLNSITYPDFPENNVTYTYGGPGAAHNRANRVVTISDESGLEEFFYGRLGEIVKTVKTVASDTLGQSPNSPEVYTTEYVYDTWNRLQSLTYPDGEVLTYTYDSGGLPNAASGSKGGWRYEYINRLEYDKFGDPEFTEVGNKVRTAYGYNPLNRCLEVIQAGQGMGSGNLFQDLRLTCDNVGNITAQANLAADRSPSQMGGATQYTYVYDDLNRLVHAEGTFDYEPNKQHRYQLDNTYDTIHNITAKTQRHEIREPSGVLIEQHKTTYDWQYAYDGPQPHAPTHIGEWTFSYDADGNQAGWEHDRNGTRRTIVWDEESRVQSISDSGHTKTYKYNAAGQRVIKRGPQGETVYVNPFFTIRNREVGTKHVYANGMRMVSKLMKQDKPGANPKGKVPLEKDLYFYHPDHLGTSMYVTDAKGDLYEHLEYFPFGETFVEESSNTQRTPYLFTAKELDEETQLYYFGARYFDPQTSVWLSPDPLLDEYLPAGEAEASLPGTGGVYNSRNLQLYGYAGQNPVTYVDPEGSSFRSALRGAGRRIGSWLSSRQRLATGDDPSFSISIPIFTFKYYGKAAQSPGPSGAAKSSRFRRYLSQWRISTVIGEIKGVIDFPNQLLASKETRVWYYRRTARDFRWKGRSYRWEGWTIRRLP